MYNNLPGEEDKSAFYKAFFNEGIYVVNEPELPVIKQITDETSALAETAGKNIPISGNKMAKTLLLFNAAKGDDFPAEDKIFLSQILSAVKLSMNDVSWLNSTLYDASWEDINYTSHAEIIVAFDVAEKSLPQKIAEGEILETENRKILFVDNLQQIAANKNKKKLLWEGLKTLYTI
ncbi:MAG: hypothetical protein EOP53_07330 [Sphingobacteriales bacterium]|nr:MAG: hypothetical protein EOP53_07330 [Sphingobacteriales bacterium]